MSTPDLAQIDRLIDAAKERHNAELSGLYALRQDLVADHVAGWLTYTDIAREKRISKDGARKWVERRGLPTKRLRGRVCVSREALIAASD